MLKWQALAISADYGANFTRGMEVGQRRREWEAGEDMRGLEKERAVQQTELNRNRLALEALEREKKKKQQEKVGGAMEFEKGITNWDDDDYKRFKEWSIKNPEMVDSPWYNSVEKRFEAARRQKGAMELLEQREENLRKRREALPGGAGGTPKLTPEQEDEKKIEELRKANPDMTAGEAKSQVNKNRRAAHATTEINSDEGMRGWLANPDNKGQVAIVDVGIPDASGKIVRTEKVPMSWDEAREREANLLKEKAMKKMKEAMDKGGGTQDGMQFPGMRFGPSSGPFYEPTPRGPGGSKY